MATPPTRNRAKIWDILRDRKVINLDKVASKKELFKQIDKEVRPKQALWLKRSINKSNFWDYLEKKRAPKKVSVSMHFREGRVIKKHTRSYKVWSSGDTEFLLSNKKAPVSVLSKKLKRSESSVRTKL